MHFHNFGTYCLEFLIFIKIIYSFELLLQRDLSCRDIDIENSVFSSILILGNAINWVSTSDYTQTKITKLRKKKM